MTSAITLAQWEARADEAGRRERTITGQGVPGPNFREYMRGIHDTPSIEGVRWQLFGLSDYLVSSVTGGVVWLIPGESAPAKWRREQEADERIVVTRVTMPAQPRLPGEAGTVRDIEIQHPQFEQPRARPDDFELRSESGAGTTPRLF